MTLRRENEMVVPRQLTHRPQYRDGLMCERHQMFERFLFLAEIIRALDSEHIECHGRQISRREFELRMFQAKALKGELAAAKHLESLRQSSGQRETAVKTGGVLLLSAKVPLHEWEASAAIQQAKYRSSEDEE
jgi:hypothetical protein